MPARTTPIAVNTAVFEGYPLGRGFDVLSGLGVELVELGYTEGYAAFAEDAFTEANGRHIRSEAEARGLTIRSVAAHVSPASVDLADRLGSRLSFAQGAGAKILITNAPNASTEAAFIEVIRRLGPRLTDAGIGLCLENPGYGQPTLLDHPDRVADLLRRFPAVGLNLDVCNFHTRSPELDVEAAIEKMDALLPLAMQVHLKNFTVLDGLIHFGDLLHGELPIGRISRRIAARKITQTIEMPLRLRRKRDGAPFMSVDLPPIDRIASYLGSSIQLLAAASVAGDE